MKKIFRYTFPFIFFVFCDETYSENIYFINSNETTYINEHVNCVGKVIMMYCGKVLSADKVSYDKKKDIIFAEGNVVIKDEKQNVYFMDSVRIERNFENGEGKNIKIIMSDKSRFAAAKVVIKNKKFELTNVVYTPCYKCGPSDKCSWKIKSEQVMFNPNESIVYLDSRFDVLEKTVLYLPYLSQPSPKVLRKTGFLPPTVFISQKNGLSIMPRYFYSISERQELVLKPLITTNVGAIGWAYYGSRFKNGEFSIDTSITGAQSAVITENMDPKAQRQVEKIQQSGYRGHLFSKLKYEINDTWRCGFDLNLSSDRSYLRRFPFFGASGRTLESKIFLEGFDECNYTSIKAATFQSEELEILPKIFPVLERNCSIHLFDGTLDIDTILLNFSFPKSRSAQKFSSNISWKKNFMLLRGSILNLKGLVSLRAMKVAEKEASSYDSCAYAVPQLSVFWEWPLLFQNKGCSSVVTPIVGAIFASNKKYFDAFEDPFCEINDINIAEGSRAISPYNIDYGNRISYALRASTYLNGKNISQFIIGRSTELSSVSDKLEASGLKYKNSNIATSLDIFINDNVTFLAKGSYSTQKKEWLKITSGLKFIYKQVEADILAFNGEQYYFNPFAKNIHQISDDKKVQPYKGFMADIGWQLTETVKLKSEIIFDSVHNKILQHSAGMVFKNECTDLEFSLEKTNYQQGDLKADTILRLAVHLKNLGI